MQTLEKDIGDSETMPRGPEPLTNAFIYVQGEWLPEDSPKSAYHRTYKYYTDGIAENATDGQQLGLRVAVRHYLDAHPLGAVEKMIRDGECPFCGGKGCDVCDTIRNSNDVGQTRSGEGE